MQKPIDYEKILADLLGDEASRAVARGKRDVPTITEAQMKQAVTVIPSIYWGLKCWKCRENDHSTFTCPYLNADQRVIFAYRCYLQKVTADPHTKLYLEEKLQHQVSIDRQKQGIAQKFMGEKNLYGRESALGQGRSVQLAARGRTPYPGHAQPSGTRGVFNVVEEESGPIGDEWQRVDGDSQADQPQLDSGHKKGRPRSPFGKP